MVVGRIPWIGLLALAAASGGCGATDAGQTQFAGMVTYQSPTGAYSFRYLSPPWSVVKVSGDTVDLKVAPDLLTLTPSSLEAVPYQLSVAAHGDAYRRAAEAEAEQHEGDASVPQPVRDPAGQEIGQELLWQESASGRYHRDAYFAAGANRSFEMAFSARTKLADDPMIGQMLASFTVAKETGRK